MKPNDGRREETLCHNKICYFQQVETRKKYKAFSERQFKRKALNFLNKQKGIID